MKSWKTFNPTKSFDVEQVLDFHGRMIDGGGPYNYSGTCPNNTKAEYLLLNWSLELRPMPDFDLDLVANFNYWKNSYESNPALIPDLHILLDSFITPLQALVAGKADSSSVASALSPINTALSTKVNGKSNMYLHEAQATSDSSSVVTIHLTVDGLSTGAALFSGVPKVVATGKDSTGSPIASPQVAELAWSNSNKTVTFKTSRATNMLLLGNSAVATGAGAVVDVIAYGTKA